jgi:transcriptional regulator
VFQGPHAYVSASWYEEPYATVPTWNYSAVHVVGRLREFDAWEAVRLLSRTIEGSGASAWDPERLDERYRANQLRGIVAFELHAKAIYAKAKLSQNRSDVDRRRVIERLGASADQTDRECAEAMIKAYTS